MEPQDGSCGAPSERGAIEGRGAALCNPAFRKYCFGKRMTARDEMPMRPETAFESGLAIDARTDEAFVRIPGALEQGTILLCDHAANALPEAYGTLGLPAAELARHIAYDIGAQGLTEKLALRLGAPAVMTRVSRSCAFPTAPSSPETGRSAPGSGAAGSRAITAPTTRRLPRSSTGRCKPASSR
jgi:hypothetical protein